MPASQAEGEDWFRTLLDGAPTMIWISGLDGGCTYFNRRWLEYTGRSMKEELGAGWAAGVHPDDLPPCMASYLDHFARQAPFRLEYRLRRADGSYGSILDDGVPRYGKDGAFLGFIGSCIDITDQKEAQRLARTHTITRALASRLLHEVVFRARVPAHVLRETGRALASEKPLVGGLEDYARTFQEMGFGDLRFDGDQAGRIEFSGTDLLERRPSAALPSCYLTLGFLEGAVASTTGRRVLGNEMRCQSLGHDACRFLLMVQ